MDIFFSTLFEEDANICLTEESKGTSVYPLNEYKNISKDVKFMSLNSLLNEDTCPSKEWHNKNTPRRADDNVSVFRNILIEIDNLPLAEQLPFIIKSKLPHTSAVFSGSKSIHFIISLEKPLKDKKEYSTLVKRVYSAFQAFGNNVIDKSNKNPSRLTRVPNALRDGKEQTLMYVNSRVNNEELNSWINSLLESNTEVPNISIDNSVHTVKRGNGLKPSTIAFLLMGAGKGNRNNAIYSASCDLAINGISFEESFNRIKAIVDLDEEEIIETITSAYNRKDLYETV